MNSWLKKAKQTIAKEDYYFFNTVCSFNRKLILQEINELEEMLNTDAYNEKTFIHGDINHGNIISNKIDYTLTLVDYEFSGYGER